MTLCLCSFRLLPLPHSWTARSSLSRSGSRITGNCPQTLSSFKVKTHPLFGWSSREDSSCSWTPLIKKGISVQAGVQHMSESFQHLVDHRLIAAWKRSTRLWRCWPGVWGKRRTIRLLTPGLDNTRLSKTIHSWFTYLLDSHSNPELKGIWKIRMVKESKDKTFLHFLHNFQSIFLELLTFRLINPPTISSPGLFTYDWFLIGDFFISLWEFIGEPGEGGYSPAMPLITGHFFFDQAWLIQLSSPSPSDSPKKISQKKKRWVWRICHSSGIFSQMMFL